MNDRNMGIAIISLATVSVCTLFCITAIAVSQHLATEQIVVLITATFGAITTTTVTVMLWRHRRNGNGDGKSKP